MSIINLFQIPPYEVALSNELVEQVDSVLQTFDLAPADIQQGIPEPQSLLQHEKKVFADTTPRHAGVVSWSPPQPNWNPWTGSNIDEGPLAMV